MKGTINHDYTRHRKPLSVKSGWEWSPIKCEHLLFLLDLAVGNVLLFPIDDKQSRLDGQDQVGSFKVKLTPLPGNAHLFHDERRLLAVAGSWVHMWWQNCEVVATDKTVTVIRRCLNMFLPTSSVGPDSSTAKRQGQQLVWDPFDRSGWRSEEDLRCSQKKQGYSLKVI